MVEKKVEEIKKEQTITDRYTLAQVPETMRVAVVDNKTEVVLSEMDVLLTILNKVEKIERSVA
jgi:hypothetical protein